MVLIEGFEDYSVTGDGKVWSFISNRWLKPGYKKGYKFIILCKNKKHYNKAIHRLVAEAFIPNPDNKPEVNHKDGNKLNNSVDNLEWNTKKENVQHAWKNGLCEKNRIIVLKNAKRASEARKKKVQCIETGEIFESATSASKFFGLHTGNIYSSIRRNSKSCGYTWVYI